MGKSPHLEGRFNAENDRSLDLDKCKLYQEAKTLPFEQRIQTMNNKIGPRHRHVI